MGNKKEQVLCMNGPNKGCIIEIEHNYTAEEEEAKKAKMRIRYGNVDYAGWCRRCGSPVLQGEAVYQSNTNTYGALHVDVLHRLCSK